MCARTEASPSWRLYGFILLTSVVAGIAFSLAPALKAARHLVNPSLAGTLKLHLSRKTGEPAKRSDSAAGFIVLTATGYCCLLMRTLQNLRDIDTGYEKTNLLMASINPALSGYSPEKSHVSMTSCCRRTRAPPNVTQVWPLILQYPEGDWNHRR